MAVLPVVLEGTRTLVRPNLLFNWGNRIRIRVLPPVTAEEVAVSEVHELMERTHAAMCDALRRMRETN